MNRPDPIIDEIHREREEHAARFDYDMHRIVEDIKEQASRILPNAKLVSLPPKRVDIDKRVHHN